MLNTDKMHRLLTPSSQTDKRHEGCMQYSLCFSDIHPQMTSACSRAFTVVGKVVVIL